MVRVANAKMPRLLALARHVEIIIIEAQKPRSTTLMGSRTLLATTGTLDLENPPCNAEDNLRAGLIVIEAWFRGYRGSPGLGGIRTAGLYTLAGLLDREDTRLKTLSRVGWDSPLHGRQAWRSEYCISFLVTDSM